MTCANGHDISAPDAFYTYGNGKRECRQCVRARNVQHYARRKADRTRSSDVRIDPDNYLEWAREALARMTPTDSFHIRHLELR